MVALVEDAVHDLVLAILAAVGAVVLRHTALELVHPHRAFSARVTDSINGVLFVIIVMELLRTVAAHFEHTGFQLQPFLIIGIISSVRHILTIGARLTLSGEGAGASFSHSQIELAVEAGVVLVLSLGLVLIRRSSPGENE